MRKWHCTPRCKSSDTRGPDCHVQKHQNPLQLRSTRDRRRSPCRFAPVRPKNHRGGRMRAAALQFVRKITGFNKPAKANEASFLAAVEEVAAISTRLLRSLETAAVPRNREEEAAKAKARAAERFGN